ncbi:MAG: L,D-transpeptidase family protein [Planctomycetota bacterium]
MKGTVAQVAAVLAVVVLLGGVYLVRGRCLKSGPVEGPPLTVATDARTEIAAPPPSAPAAEASPLILATAGEAGTAASSLPAGPAMSEASPELLEGLRYRKEGKRAEANELLVKALPTAGARETEVLSALQELGREMFLDPVTFAHLKLYTVRRGDTLSELSARYSTTIEMIKRLNSLRTDQILVGQRLVLPSGPAKIIIWKGKFRLMVMIGPYCVAYYSVGIGKLDKTPSAEFRVDVKVKNPDWYPPEGGVIKFGDPRNLLGTRWLGFSEMGKHNGLGIHGTTHEQSIGRSESRGCVRMRNRDVEEVFDMVPIGAFITIYD